MKVNIVDLERTVQDYCKRYGKSEVVFEILEVPPEEFDILSEEDYIKVTLEPKNE